MELLLNSKVPHVVRFLEYNDGTVDNLLPMIFMEVLSNGTLDNLIEQSNEVSYEVGKPRACEHMSQP
jgi:hypothetical protein